jgi:hypothetical protein
MNLLARDRSMLNTFGHDIEFARTERHRAIPQFDVQTAFQDEKEIVGVVVLVPGELSLHLHHHHVAVVEGRDRARRPEIPKSREFVGKRYAVGHVSPVALS